MPNLSAVIRADYITRLAQAGIPVQPSQRTADQGGEGKPQQLLVRAQDRVKARERV